MLSVVPFAAAYGLAWEVGLALRLPDGGLPAVRPAAGIAVAVFVLARPERLARLAATLFVVDAGLELLAGRDVGPALVLAAVNTVVPLAVRALLARLPGAVPTRLLAVPADLARITIAGAVGALPCAVAGTLATADVPGMALRAAALAWWVSDLLGILLAMPVALALVPGRRRALSAGVRSADLAYVAALLGATWAVFAGSPGGALASADVVLLPLLLVCAVHLRPGATAVVLGALAVLADVLTGRGSGPFVSPGGQVHTPALQGFLAGVTLATLCLALAVAAERSARADLTSSEDLVRNLLAAATEQAIIASDLDGLVTVFNSGAERMLGRSAADVVGVLRAQDMYGPDDGQPAPLRAARSATPITHERDVLRVDGGHVPVRLSSTLIRRGPEVVGRLDVGTDISAERRLAGALRSALDQERRAVGRLSTLDAEKSGFLAQAGHDLRTPLTSILGHLEVLADNPGSDATSHSLKIIERNAKRLHALVDSLLAVPTDLDADNAVSGSMVLR